MKLLLSLLFALPSMAEEFCTVKGHGPYDQTFKDCIELAKSQAQTDCNLKEATQAVPYIHQSTKTSKAARGHCTSKFLPKDCAPAVCSPDSTKKKRHKKTSKKKDHITSQKK